ncbi:MAG: carboxypeptidase-like regulatory domain-containing protein [Candidatus Acidiferrales bacterium]
MRRSVLAVAVMATLGWLTLWTLGAATAKAQFARGLGTLEGSVLDARGKPVADASVTIQTSDGLSPHATHTDSDGRYEFARFDAGQYDLRAYARGRFSDWSKHIVIRPKKKTEVTLRLPPDSNETVVVTSKP